MLTSQTTHNSSPKSAQSKILLAEIRWVLVGWDDGQTNCGFPPYLLQKDPGTAGRTERFWIYPSRGLEFLRRLLQDKTSQTHARSTLVAVRPAHKCHGSCTTLVSRGSSSEVVPWLIWDIYGRYHAHNCCIYILYSRTYVFYFP